MLHALKKVLVVSVLFTVAAGQGKEADFSDQIDQYNYIAGIQTIGSKYQFTDKTRLLETAEIIYGMGSNILKFNMGPAFSVENYAGSNPGNYKNLTDLAKGDASIRTVLDMPFYYYFIWVNPMSKSEWQWKHHKKPFSEEEAKIEYQEIYDLTCYLLKKYSGSGKSFYLGHWEGDWLLLGSYDRTKNPQPWRVQNMIDWLNLRQKAVDDAKRDTPHKEVQIYHYTEVNLVRKGMQGGPCLTTEVLPHVNVDYVSYSAYDAQPNPARSDLLARALDFIEEHLPEKEGLFGKRVFIGEFGYKASAFSPEVQCRNSMQFLENAVEWGCPFVLYWQLYDNEFVHGKYEGYWLIDDQGEKQPLFYALQNYYREARDYLHERAEADGSLPDRRRFLRKAETLMECETTR